MKNIKKAVVLLLAVLLILAYANYTFASTIQPRNTSDGNTSGGNTSLDEGNTAGNEIENISNNTSNIANNTAGLRNSTSNYTPINATNSAQDIPKTGVEDNLNFALFLLLALVLGMFSLVQYRRMVKKDE